MLEQFADWLGQSALLWGQYQQATAEHDRWRWSSEVVAFSGGDHEEWLRANTRYMWEPLPAEFEVLILSLLEIATDPLVIGYKSPGAPRYDHRGEIQELVPDLRGLKPTEIIPRLVTEVTRNRRRMAWGSE